MHKNPTTVYLKRTIKKKIKLCTIEENGEGSSEQIIIITYTADLFHICTLNLHKKPIRCKFITLSLPEAAYYNNHVLLYQGFLFNRMTQAKTFDIFIDRFNIQLKRTKRTS